MRKRRIDLFGLRAIASSRASLTLLLMLLGADVLYIIGHLRADREVFELSLSFLDIEYGYPEAFQSLQWLWAIGLVVLIVAVRRSWVYLCLAPMLLFFLLTDRYSFHERGGRVLVEAISLPAMFGLRPQDLGELLIMLGALIVVVPSLLIGIRFAAASERRRLVRVLAITGIIVFFGVVLDAVHILVIEEPMTGDAFGLIEDGGEMLGATLLVAYLFQLWLEPRGATRAESESSRERAAPTMVE